MLMYIEKKDDGGHQGTAWIARVVLSESKHTVYFNGRALRRANTQDGNHVDTRTGESFWVSGVKRGGSDRHRFGGGVVFIEESAVYEYLQLTGSDRLNTSRLKVIADLPPTDPADFVDEEHEPL